MKRTLSILAALATTAGLQAAVTSTTGNVVTYTGGIASDNRITEDTVWTNDMIYVLDGKIYVTDGASLTIEAGTLIKGEDEEEDAASALIISRGSKIFALGTPSEPIVFTSIQDTSMTSVHDTSPMDDLDTGLWGGIVILGDGLLNSDKEKGGEVYPNIDDHVEGIVANDFTEFGGTSNDNSQGIFRYVSIRHGGQTLDADNELNGLTLGGVTDKTIIEFVEIFSNSDDGIEIFGGNVNPRFIVAAFGKDDSFDWDSGWEGYGQFWLSIGSATGAGDQDHGAEMDGIVFNGDNVVAEQRGLGTIFNATIIGPGSASGVSEGLFEISDDAGVRYYNSIFTAFGSSSHVIDIKDDANDGLTEILTGDTVPRIDFQNNIWFDFGAGTDPLDWVIVSDGDGLLVSDTEGDVIFSDAAHNNTVEDPMFTSLSRISDGGFDPRPAAGSPAWTNARQAYPNDWFIPVSYQGAMGSANWLYGWTKLSTDGYLPAMSAAPVPSLSALSAVVLAAEGGDARGGIVVGGELPQLFIVRAVGPKLVDRGIAAADVMPNPKFRIRKAGTGVNLLETFDWAADASMIAPIETLQSYVGLAGLTQETGETVDDTQSAVAIISLNPGVYTIFAEDEGGLGGRVQLEVYGTDR